MKFNSKTCVAVLVWAAALLNMTGTGWVHAAAGLDASEADGYLQWLHSLEQTVAGRQAAEQAEGNLLYPFDIHGWLSDTPQPYRHLAISKALTDLEGEMRHGERRRSLSALVALANARNYVNLSEYDSALVWFQAAAERDSAGNFRREIGRESLAAAAAAADSAKVAQLLTNTLGTPELIGREGELVLAYRWLLAETDSEGIDLLIQKVNAQQAVLSDRLRFWHAYALNWRHRRPECFDHLRKLIRSGGLSRDLSESQRSWVLLAIPDLLFIEGVFKKASDLYRALANSDIDELRYWGKYQAANIDFLGGRYLRASNGFKDVCEATRLGGWQDQACAMADVAGELERIRAEGEAYGAAVYYNQ